MATDEVAPEEFLTGVVLTARDVLKELVDVGDEDALRQFSVMWEAFEIFRERKELYEDAWAEYGAVNNIVRAASKMRRILNRVWGKRAPYLHETDSVLDDAFDVINYATFAIRQGRKGEWYGRRQT